MATPAEAVALIRSAGGGFFTVEFIKRTTGELRTMTCRLGVTKHLKGGEQPYRPADYGLLTVYDMVKKGYRSIPLDALKRVTVNGTTIVVF